MVRTRFRANLAPFLFHVFSALVAGYFVWHAVHGQRGLKAGDEFATRISELQSTLDGLRAERARWERNIGLVRGETIDRDMLDEQTRIELGRVQKNEVVIFVAPPKASSN